MKNASTARNFGSTSGRIVFTQPNCWNRMYCGIDDHVERQHDRREHDREQHLATEESQPGEGERRQAA